MHLLLGSKTHALSQVLGYAVSVIGFAIYSKLKMTVQQVRRKSGKPAGGKQE